jgi:hypothetical protein
MMPTTLRRTATAIARSVTEGTMPIVLIGGAVGAYFGYHGAPATWADGDQPVAITGVEQIRHRLAARGASLPAVPASIASGAADVMDGNLPA